MAEPDVTSVDLGQRFAQLDTGERIPVSNMFDDDGREVCDPDLCRRAVAGPDADGRWFAFFCEAPDD